MFVYYVWSSIGVAFTAVWKDEWHTENVSFLSLLGEKIVVLAWALSND